MPDESRLDVFEEKIGIISTGQAVIESKVTDISEAISNLVDLRAESLHLIKQQEMNRKDHDEMFNRIRELEDAKATCVTERVSIKAEIKENVKPSIHKLEKNQRWGVLAIIAVVISAVSPFIKKAISALFQ